MTDLVPLRQLIRELAEEIHQTGSIRDHADPNDKTGWNVHGIETCEYALCVAALAATASTPEPYVAPPTTTLEIRQSPTSGGKVRLHRAAEGQTVPEIG